MENQVTLNMMLEARERRIERQKRLLDKYSGTLLCFTMNIAGPIKIDPLIRKGFEFGMYFLNKQCETLGIEPIYTEKVFEITGCEAFYIFQESPLLIKKMACEIEDATALGRLLDLDVLVSSGKKIGRTEVGKEPRHCLLCEKSAAGCARSRAHTVSALQKRTKEILLCATKEKSVGEIARLACRALLYEVCTTPKPGLVDCNNNGSHNDMDIFTFLDSSIALQPYFELCVRIGRDTADNSPRETFFQLRKAGKNAEKDMLAATRNVNTHKGAIFSVGILCAALGRIKRAAWYFPDEILKECAAIAKGITETDLGDITAKTAVTVGERLYLNYKITGIRGEAESGFPAVRDFGLPVLIQGIKKGMSINDAGCAALLTLMSEIEDSTLISRSDLETQVRIKKELKTFLAENPYPDKKLIEKMDFEFIKKNLSAGGSADLLAVCYFLYFVTEQQ